MLPSFADLQVTISSSLELAMELAYGPIASSSRVSRITQLLRRLVADSVVTNIPVPSAVFFSRIDHPRTSNVGLVLTTISTDDRVLVEHHPCTLATLDEYAAATSRDIDSTFAVYTRTTAGQHFYVAGKAIRLADYYEPCIFLHGTHYDLHDALVDYGTNVAPSSDCGHLRQCWEREQAPRLSTGVQQRMRDSLGHFLSHRLRNHVVDKGFAIDDIGKVDISVEWKNARRRGFVSVDWLGEGADVDRSDASLVSGNSTRLLNESLVPYRTAHSDVELLGYITVFDARTDKSVQVAIEEPQGQGPLLRSNYIWAMNPPKDL